jgi:hypothetical protein
MTIGLAMRNFGLLAASASAVLILTAADAAWAGGRTAGKGIPANGASAWAGGHTAGKGILTNGAGSKTGPVVRDHRSGVHHPACYEVGRCSFPRPPTGGGSSNAVVRDHR